MFPAACEGGRVDQPVAQLAERISRGGGQSLVQVQPG